MKNILLSFFAILLGAFIIFNVWWSHGGGRFLGIIAFFVIAGGSLFLSISLTKIMIPIQADISFSVLSEKDKYEILKRSIGQKKLKMINICYISLFLILFAATAVGLVISVNKYEKYQLKTYGLIQKVKINTIEHKGKGDPYAFFDFYLDGKKYSTDLSQKNYTVGDSATIIFSTDNTDIVDWAEDFNVSE
ncbi:hypothetical protein CEY12_18185 [Chryseobacterium sp. T16E-39]|uniref:hypothetical protein n=1 Tax=Chryseobacterium sp. T16E-39 TaxID=2015076 RepID=UPI000B5B455A|nr:hypothetical protein [Chryseobacterium sp. T16E-39]ASK31917.1 hypothetical protein CEY12_18185 [Chryseobacterium sp. T16E-39]